MNLTEVLLARAGEAVCGPVDDPPVPPGEETCLDWKIIPRFKVTVSPDKICPGVVWFERPWWEHATLDMYTLKFLGDPHKMFINPPFLWKVATVDTSRLLISTFCSLVFSPRSQTNQNFFAHFLFV